MLKLSGNPTRKAIVPYSLINPKTRLAPILNLVERRELTSRLPTDMLAALNEALVEPLVLCPEPMTIDAPVRVDEQPLTLAINC